MESRVKPHTLVVVSDRTASAMKWFTCRQQASLEIAEGTLLAAKRQIKLVRWSVIVLFLLFHTNPSFVLEYYVHYLVPWSLV